MLSSFWRLESILPRVFFWSGVACLFFQVAWQRLLTVNYGVGSVSITLIVSVYMLGLGLGALVGGYIADFAPRRLLVYAPGVVELSLALFGVCSLPLLQFLGQHTAGASIGVSLLSMCAFLCLPTVGMGLTLPLMVKIFDRPGEKSFLESISLLYAINTLGATLGCLLASYVVISFLGLDWAVYIASAIDFILSLLIFKFAHTAQASVEENTQPAQPIVFHDWIPFVTIVTGFLAIGYEIVWLRFLQVFLKSSPYTFSTILSVYLAGIGIGSYVMSVILAKHQNLDRRSVFFLLQVFISVYVLISIAGYYWLTNNTEAKAVTAWIFSAYQVLRPDEQTLLNNWLIKYPWLVFIRQYSFVICPLLFMFVPTFFMGGTFPLLSYLSLPKRDQQGQTVGAVYFMNTVGNVCGGIVTGFLLLSWLGTEWTFLLFGLVGLSMILFVRSIGSLQLAIPARLAIFTVAAAIAIAVFPAKGEIWRAIHMSTTAPAEQAQWRTYVQEGEDAIVFTMDNGHYLRNSINGLTHGARGSTFMFQRETLEAVACTKNPRNVLIIGFGAGATLDALLQDRRIEHITLVEICRSNLENLKKIESIRKTLEDPRVTIVIEDGRRYLQANKNKYDLILIDPLRTIEAYSNNLYSKQFMQLLSERLDSGILLVWLDNFDILPNTISKAFPYLNVYNYFCLASRQPIQSDRAVYDQILSKFPKDEQEKINKQETILLATENTLRSFVHTEVINEDWRPASEYYFGRTIINKVSSN